MRSLPFLALLCSTILAGTAASVDAEPTADAVQAAKTYIGLLKTGEARRAVTEFWDADALLSHSFGLTYLDLTEAERKRSQGAFADFLAAPFTNERLLQLFKTIDIQEATPTQIDPSTVAVRMQLVGDAGRFRAVNTLLLAKSGEAWKITDQRQGDQQSMRVALAMMYASSVKSPADTVPVVLERVAADTRKQMSAK